MVRINGTRCHGMKKFEMYPELSGILLNPCPTCRNPNPSSMGDELPATCKWCGASMTRRVILEDRFGRKRLRTIERSHKRTPEGAKRPTNDARYRRNRKAAVEFHEQGPGEGPGKPEPSQVKEQRANEVVRRLRHLRSSESKGKT